MSGEFVPTIAKLVEYITLVVLGLGVAALKLQPVGELPMLTADKLLLAAAILIYCRLVRIHVSGRSRAA